MNTIRTERYKNYGPLEDQAEGIVDVETFVFQNGEIVPVDQTQNATTTVIKTADEPNFGQLEDQANGLADVEAFVFRNGEVVPASQAENSSTPVINTARLATFNCAHSFIIIPLLLIKSPVPLCSIYLFLYIK